MLPNFIIVGAARAGTTALYYYLSQHPEIGLPALKEPKYFSSIHLNLPHKGVGDQTVDKYAVSDIEAYKKLFLPLKAFKRVGEASPDYLYYYKQTAGQIRDTLGDIPILIILRDPVERAFSAYMYLVRDSREKLTFREALDAEKERLDSNWDFIWGYKSAGLYYEQVKAFMDNFSQVKVILNEDLRDDREVTLRDIYRFLGVADDFVSKDNLTYNPSGRPSNWLAGYLLSREHKTSTLLREALKRLLPRKVLERMAGRYLLKAEIEELDVLYLRKYFFDDTVKLERLIKRDLSSWK